MISEITDSNCSDVVGPKIFMIISPFELMKYFSGIPVTPNSIATLPSSSITL